MAIQESINDLAASVNAVATRVNQLAGPVQVALTAAQEQAERQTVLIDNLVEVSAAIDAIREQITQLNELVVVDAS